MTINDTVNVDSDFRKLALEPIESQLNNHILLIVLLVRKNLKTLKTKWGTSTQAKLSAMKYYRFSRLRNDYFRYFRSKKKSDYMIRTYRSKILDSGNYDNQVWGSLHKAWKGYVIAKNKDEYDKMVHYARVIQENQHDLGLEVSSFDNIGMSASSFLLELVQKDDNNQVSKEASDEDYQTESQYEQDRFTDTYTEDFEDDENKVDRFTDDYHENFTD
ncbi:MAG: hypothetical protein ACJ71K_18755 [Nitrososphaeraceae archaeon]|jgi:hypothetical protein